MRFRRVGVLELVAGDEIRYAKTWWTVARLEDLNIEGTRLRIHFTDGTHLDATHESTFPRRIVT